MKEIKFRFFDKVLKKIIYRNLEKYDIEHKDIIVMQFTGFMDFDGKEIYDGDILSDEVKTDEGIIKSKCKVFWSQYNGQWRLDSSYNQDGTFSSSLGRELRTFKYKVTGNIYENASENITN